MMNPPRIAMALALLLGVAPALAQYRPPPMTEGERLTALGNEARLEANAAIARGDKRGAQERYHKAMTLFLKALSAESENLAAAGGLGEVAAALGEHQKVVEVLTPIAQRHPDSVELSYFLGVSLFKLKRYPEGVPLLEAVSAANKPEHLIAHYYLGRYYLHVQRPDPAATEFERYLSQRPEKLAGSDDDILLMLGQAHELGNRAEQARAAYERVLKLKPGLLAAELGVASTLIMAGKNQDAATHLSRLARQHPKQPAPRERLGWLLLSVGELARAEQMARDVIQLQPKSASGHQLLGEIHLAAGRAAESEKALRSAVQLNPAVLESRLSLAKAIQLQGRNDEAIKLLEEVASAGLATVDVWSVLGSVYRRAGRFIEAVKTHRKVVELIPSQAKGYVLLGADHYASGQWALAIEQYDQALKVAPDHADARKWLAHSLLQRARGHARADQLGDAERDLRRALDLHGSAAIARSLGSVLLAGSQFGEASRVLQRAVRLPDATWQESMLLGYALLGQGNAAEALSAFEASARLTPEQGHRSDIYAGWALAKLELGQFDVAVERLSEAGDSKTAYQVARLNLPLALIRRSLGRLRDGDVSGAQKDLEAAEKLGPHKSQEVRDLAAFAKVLVDIENGAYDQAWANARRTLGKRRRSKFERPNSALLLQAYLNYRRGLPAASIRPLAQARGRAESRQAEWMAQLSRAVEQREGELLYKKGRIKPAGKVLQAAAEADPLNTQVVNNLACTQYLSGQATQAVAAWESIASTVPEANLNLGIAAQARKDPARAVEFYAKYISAGGARSALVREWKDRLQSIHAIPVSVAKEIP